MTLTAAGLMIDNYNTIVDDIETDQRLTISAELDQSADGPVGQINALFALKLAELEEILLSIYNNFNPDAATADALENLCLLSGITRDPATYSTVVITCAGTPATVIPAGSIVSNITNTVSFTSQAAGTIDSGGDIDIAFTCNVAGAVIANAATLTIIQTPVSGWATTTNALDAVAGSDIESDATLRARRESQLSASGAGTVDAIRADVLAVDAVTAVSILKNGTDVIDSNGLPPHSFEAIVHAGIDNEVAQAIWNSEPAGIQSFGSASGTAIDAVNSSHTVAFTRPVDVAIYIAVTVSIDSSMYAGDDAAKNKILEYEDDLSIGDNVLVWRVGSGLDDVAGVNNVTALAIGLSSPATGTSDIAIGIREIAALDSSRITITTV